MSDIECLLGVLSFNRSRKTLYFPKIVTFFIFDGSLQPCSLVNILMSYIR